MADVKSPVTGRRGIGRRLDEVGRRHGGLMLAFTLAVAAVVTVVLLSSSEAPVVLYQAF
jgi:hypothetical protein